MLAWMVVGLGSAIVIILRTGIIPFIVPGLIIGTCGAVFHKLLARFIVGNSWWLSSLIIIAMSLSLTILLVPDTRHWVIARLIIVYYSTVAIIFCLIKSLIERYQQSPRM